MSLTNNDNGIILLCFVFMAVIICYIAYLSITTYNITKEIKPLCIQQCNELNADSYDFIVFDDFARCECYKGYDLILTNKFYTKHKSIK